LIRTRRQVREAIRREVEEGAEYDVEYRTVAPDGRSRWIRAKGRIRDGGHQPTRFDGITIDVQQQKEAEAALQAASRQKDDFPGHAGARAAQSAGADQFGCGAADARARMATSNCSA
jgi:hypothetical protein